jgi:hypothetical protein
MIFKIYKKFFLAGILLTLLAVAYSCDGIFPTAPHDNLLLDHTLNLNGAFHKQTGKEKIEIEDCYECHTEDLKGMVITYQGERRWTPSCLQCHGPLWKRNNNDNSNKSE